jgi:hypothetical protein
MTDEIKLEPCPACGQMISNKAPVCIKCGHPFEGRSKTYTADLPDPPKAVEPVKKKRSKGFVVVAICAGLVASIWSLSGGRQVYERKDYSADWPYPNHDKAIVRCVIRTFGSTDRPVVTVELSGREYGLNGAALGVGKFPDPKSEERPDYSRLPGQMIAQALEKLCKWKQ